MVREKIGDTNSHKPGISNETDLQGSRCSVYPSSRSKALYCGLHGVTAQVVNKGVVQRCHFRVVFLWRFYCEFFKTPAPMQLRYYNSLVTVDFTDLLSHLSQCFPKRHPPLDESVPVRPVGHVRTAQRHPFYPRNCFEHGYILSL